MMVIWSAARMPGGQPSASMTSSLDDPRPPYTEWREVGALAVEQGRHPSSQVNDFPHDVLEDVGRIHQRLRVTRSRACRQSRERT